MDFQPKSREQKCIEVLFAYFAKLAMTHQSDQYSLKVCRHLQALKDRAIYDNMIAPMLDNFNAEYPEESYLTNEELQWALVMLDKHMSFQMKAFERNSIRLASPRAKLRVINGGLSANPDRPYTAPDMFR